MAVVGIAATFGAPTWLLAQGTSAPPTTETVQLQTSDGIQLQAVYYPAGGGKASAASPLPQAAPAAPIAILLHDLGGSNASVSRLAVGLQQRGIAVIAPDLRGHGASASGGTGAGSGLEARSLKRADFEAMTQSRGGRVRQQATVRGDVEAIREWIKSMADRGVLDMKRLFVIGSGVGAAVAAAWTAEDAAWPDIASGPQGRDVRGLVMISPAWTTRGFSIAPSLATDVVRRTVPILVIAGTKDKDAVRLFEQLRRARPAEWYEKRADQKDPTPNPKKDPKAPATLFLLELPTSDQADALAVSPGGPSGDVAGLIADFIISRPPASG